MNTKDTNGEEAPSARWIRWRRLAAALCVLAALLLATMAGLAIRQQKFEARWSKICIGMSREEARKTLGKPDDVYPAGMVNGNSLIDDLIANWLFDSFHEKWAYGRREIFASEPSFPYVRIAFFDAFFGPEEGDHVLYFSKEGRVTKKKPS